MIAFLVLAFIFNTLIMMIHYTVGQHLENYELVVENIMHINDITVNVEKIANSFDQFLNRGYGEEKTKVLAQLEDLKESQKKLNPELYLSLPSHYRLENLSHLLDEFSFQVAQTLLYYDQQKVTDYTLHYNEATKVSRFIVENAQQLITVELTSYREQLINIAKTRELIEKIGKLTFFVSILLSILFSLFIYSGVSQPIQQLVMRSRKISSGDFDVSDLSLNRKDEIGVLMHAYKVMGENIHRLLEEAKSQEEYKRLLQEMELKSLQSQINPHFLFNTLNIISRVAYLENATKTEELMTSLAKLLRYNLRKIESGVTLRDEVDMVRQYLYIQKTRFQDRITIDMHIDEECLDVELPSLTIQPIVENIFVHGIKHIEFGALVRIKIYSSEERVHIEIADNGIGMSKDTIDQILQQTYRETKQSDTTGLGMGNVIRRLQIFYHQAEVLTIQSEPEKGTCIQLLLPKKRQAA